MKNDDAAPRRYRHRLKQGQAWKLGRCVDEHRKDLEGVCRTVAGHAKLVGDLLGFPVCDDTLKAACAEYDVVLNVTREREASSGKRQSRDALRDKVAALEETVRRDGAGIWEEAAVLRDAVEGLRGKARELERWVLCLYGKLEEPLPGACGPSKTMENGQS